MHFNNCQERTNWTLRKLRRLWHCFGRCVLVWFAYPGFDFMCPTWLQESRRAPGHVHMFARIIETALVCVALFVWPFRDTAERAFDLMWIWVTVGVGAARVALFVVLGMYASWIKFSHEERALVRALCCAITVHRARQLTSRCGTECCAVPLLSRSRPRNWGLPKRRKMAAWRARSCSTLRTRCSARARTQWQWVLRY